VTKLVLHLLGPSWRRASRASRKQLAVRLTFVLLGLGIAVSIYEVSVWFLRLCYGMEVVGPLLCRRLLDIVLTVLLGVLFLSNVVAALSSFFLADDLSLLVVAPAQPRAFFSSRLLLQLFHSSAMVLVFGLPVLLAFARVAGGPFTPVAVLLTLPPLLLLPAALAAALVLLLVTLLPAGRVRAIVVALSVVTFVVLYIAVRLMEPERLLNPDGFASVVQLLSSLSGNTRGLLPSHWGTSVIASSFREAAPSGEWPAALAALWTGAGAAHVLASTLFRHLYARAFSHSLQSRDVARLSRIWSRLRGVPVPAPGRLGTPGRRPPRVDWVRALGWLAPRGAHREMLVKDAKLLLRDASQWSQLVLLLALVFVYLYNFRFFRRIGETGLIDQLVLYLLGLALAGFVTTAVSVRFAFPLVSLEGRMLWLLRSAPVDAGQLLRGKLFATLPPLLLVAETLSVVSAIILGVPPSLCAFSAAFAALTTLSMGSLAVGLGAMFPDYGAESAAKVASSFGGLICMTVALFFGLLMSLLSIYPAVVLLHTGRAVRWVPLIISVGGLCGLTALCCLLPMRLGARALQRLEV
jgi:ABC-2 type transport system permease protein